MVQIGDDAFNNLPKEICISFHGDKGTSEVLNGGKVNLPDLRDGGSASTKLLQGCIEKRFGVQVAPTDVATCIRVVVDDSEEWEESDSIQFITEKGPEIERADEHSGGVYFHAFIEDMEKDRVIVLTPSGTPPLDAPDSQDSTVVQISSAAKGTEAKQSDLPQKSVGLAYILWFFTWPLGGHRFYAGKKRTGLAMLVLFICAIIGGSMIDPHIGGGLLMASMGWAFLDIFLIPGMIRKRNAGSTS